MSTGDSFREVDVEDIKSDDAFYAWGWARLKVQQGDEVVIVKVKIRSIPQDFVDSLRSKTPRPPSRMMMVDPTTDDGRRIGAQTRGKALAPDYADEKYQAEMDDFNARFTKEIVGRGVISRLMLRQEGRPAETPEEVYRALESMGLAGAHFTELVTSILNLTSFSEDERAVFTKNA